MDRTLFDFGAVRATGRIDPDGDMAFDVDPALERATELAAAVSGAATIPVERVRAGDLHD